MSKKYGTKVKRTKSMYKKKKSPLAKVLGAVLLVALVVGLGFLGYAVGKPILDFIRTGETSTSQTQAQSSEDIGTLTDSNTESETPQITTEDIAISAQEEYMAQLIPDSALLNKGALSSYLGELNNKGIKTGVVTLKDEKGNLLYKSSLQETKETQISTGNLTVLEIKEEFEKAGIVPVVRINTLLDPLAPALFKEISYRFADNSSAWLDARPDDGGKQWANPFNTSTILYLSSVTEEISSAGFSEIIYTGTLFPYMRGYDLTILPQNVIDFNNRYKALSKLISACSTSAKSSKTQIEVKAADMVTTNDYKATAEILKDTELVSKHGVIASFNKSEFDKYFEGQIETLHSKISGKVSGIMIYSEEFSSSEVSEMTEKLKNFGYKNIIVE